MKILVIRFLAIGDVVITSALCSSLKKSFPSAQVDYLVHSVSAPLLENHPDIDNVISLTLKQRKNPWLYFKQVRALAKQGYDIIIDASSTPKSEFISLFSRNTRYKVGRYKKHRGFAYTHKVMPSELRGDKFKQRLALLKPLHDEGLPIQFVEEISLHLSDQERSAMRLKMDHAGLDFTRPVIAFSVSSKLDEKRWNDDSMRQLAVYCLDKYQAQIVFFAGMPHEQAQIELMHKQMGQHPDIYSNIDAPSLRDLLALLANCDLFVGNEGGPRHMAQAVGLPTVCVFSPIARRAEWLPRGSDRHQGIEWQDITPSSKQYDGNSLIQYEVGDQTYFKLYNRIKTEHVTRVLDDVIAKHLAWSSSINPTEADVIN